jgi:hypothetical protein
MPAHLYCLFENASNRSHVYKAHLFGQTRNDSTKTFFLFRKIMKCAFFLENYPFLACGQENYLVSIYFPLLKIAAKTLDRCNTELGEQKK